MSTEHLSHLSSVVASRTNGRCCHVAATIRIPMILGRRTALLFSTPASPSSFFATTSVSSIASVDAALHGLHRANQILASGIIRADMYPEMW